MRSSSAPVPHELRRTGFTRLRESAMRCDAMRDYSNATRARIDRVHTPLSALGQQLLIVEHSKATDIPDGHHTPSRREFPDVSRVDEPVKRVRSQALRAHSTQKACCCSPKC